MIRETQSRIVKTCRSVLHFCTSAGLNELSVVKAWKFELFSYLLNIISVALDHLLIFTYYFFRQACLFEKYEFLDESFFFFQITFLMSRQVSRGHHCRWKLFVAVIVIHCVYLTRCPRRSICCVFFLILLPIDVI